MPCALRKLKILLRVRPTPHLVPILLQSNSVHAFPPVLILSSLLCPGFSSETLGFHTNTAMQFFFSSIPATCPSCLIILDLNTRLISSGECNHAVFHYAILCSILSLQPFPVTARSVSWVCGHSLAGIAVSNPAGSMDVCLLWLLCVVRERPLNGADHSSRGVLPSVVCLSESVNRR